MRPRTAAALRYLWSFAHFMNSAALLWLINQSPTVTFSFLLLFTDLQKTTDLKPLLPCQQSGYREYYPSRNKTHLNVQSEQKDVVGTDSAIYSKKSTRIFISLTKYQSRLFFGDKPLFLTASVHSSAGATRKKKGDKNLQAASTTSILRKQVKAFVDIEFICVRGNPPETSSTGVTLSASEETHTHFWFSVCIRRWGFPPVLPTTIFKSYLILSAFWHLSAPLPVDVFFFFS